jgi:hypothetical protein
MMQTTPAAMIDLPRPLVFIFISDGDHQNAAPTARASARQRETGSRAGWRGSQTFSSPAAIHLPHFLFTNWS